MSLWEPENIIATDQHSVSMSVCEPENINANGQISI